MSQASLTAAMKNIARIAQKAQEDAISPIQYEMLEEITNKAMEVVAYDGTLADFVKEW